MLRRRRLSDGNVFLELSGPGHQFIAEIVVAPDLEADATALLKELAARNATAIASRLPPGVLAFRRRLPATATIRRTPAQQPARG